MSHIHKDLISPVGSLQVCAGYEAGCESVICAMDKIYEGDKLEAILLVDASNVFKSVNRKTFLHNIEIICQTCSKFLPDFSLLVEAKFGQLKRNLKGTPHLWQFMP